MQSSIIECSAVQSSIIECSAVQSSVIECSAEQYNRVQGSIVRVGVSPSSDTSNPPDM